MRRLIGFHRVFAEDKPAKQDTGIVATGFQVPVSENPDESTGSSQVEEA